ncbi:aminoglycoside adenylyltransferase family protein [Nitratireductor rhodophyticola]|uniref:aminoglycoside adenylyltransferase family protein n=1 Tax=Nitratireductor rhodophyticola TaxID=2854036 RepID=UPI002AC99D7F|nr:aminoglycoside adenylyltransferase family protein [Nitratireductor rhodophyticola]WPZ15139.1 aminoglycoside adenylyltransferase family protein [Nitratireductor rhodophyticola]
MDAPTGTEKHPAEALQALSLLRQWLGDALIAVYLHGSAVTQGLRTRSDVDVFAVVDEAMTASARAGLTGDLLAISGHYPFDKEGRRPLEVVIFQRADLTCMPYPARAEFVYGEWLREVLKQGAVSEAEASPEYTLLLAQAREEAISLIGPRATELIPEVPHSTICRAIGDLLPELLRSLKGDERNVLLTLARMWLTVGTGHFVSKNAAADWALAQLSGDEAAVVTIARDAYLGNGDDDLHLRRTQVWHAAQGIKEHILTALRELK